MSRLVVVSNRVTIASDKKAQAGGLAVALQDALNQFGGVWFGWSGKVVPKTPTEPTITKVKKVTYATIDLSRKLHAEYYNGFANRALWPLFHYRLDLTAFSQQHYSSYQEVNKLFASQLLPLLKSDDLIWVHDYHLVPLGEELREGRYRPADGVLPAYPLPGHGNPDRPAVAPRTGQGAMRLRPGRVPYRERLSAPSSTTSSTRPAAALWAIT